MNIKKKKIFIILTIISVITASIILTLLFKFSKKTELVAEQRKNIFYLYDKSNEDIYTISDNDKKIKLASNANYVTYSDELKSYIIVDKDNVLYKVDDKEIKDKISSDVLYNKVQVGPQGQVFFLTKDLGLYVKEKDKDKSKLASSVSDFSVESDSSVIFKDDKNNLYIKRNGKDKIKIASNADDFKINSTLNIITYVSEGTLYLKDIDKDEKDKLVEHNNLAPFEFASDKALVYMEDYKSDYKKGELFYKEIGKDKVKIASDVSSIQVVSDGVFYVNSDKTLYYKAYKGDKNVKILDDVEQILKSKNDVFVINTDKNLYSVNQKGEKEKLNQDILNFKVTSDSIVSTNKEKDLYIGNKKIAGDILDFSVNENDVAYINSSKEVYLIKNSANPEKVINDAKEYKKIEFNNNPLFVNTLGASDIAGCWKGSDGENYIYVKFDGINNISAYSFYDSKNAIKFEIDNATQNSMNIKGDFGASDIVKVDKDTLKITNGNWNKEGVNFKRISEDEYNKTKGVVDKILANANNKSFNGTKNINGKVYYKYGSGENATYFDENGDLYNVNSEEKVESKSSASGVTYNNSWFHYSITYPSTFDMRESGSTDGISGLSKDGAELRVWGENNDVLNKTTQSLYNDEMRSKPNIGYNNLSDRSFVVTWEENGYLYYYCMVVGSGSMNGFEVKYPKELNNKYTDIIQKIYDSFKVGDLNKSWNRGGFERKS